MATGRDRRVDGSERAAISVLHVHVAVEFDGDRRDEGYDHELESAASRQWGRLEAGLRDSVAEHLGPEFEARLRMGHVQSIEVVATILLVGSIVASYNAVRDGLINVRGDFRWLVERTLAQVVGFPIEVAAYFEPGPAMTRLSAAPDPPVSSGGIVVRPQRLPLPRWFLTGASGLLFVVLLGWLVVPLLLIANVL